MMELSKFMFEVRFNTVDNAESLSWQNQMFREFNLQLINPLAPADIKSYGVFLEPELRIKVTKASQAKVEKL